MASRVPSRFFVRHGRAWLVAASVMLIVMGAGCRHRRSALRPVYMTPAPAVVAPASPCPAGSPCDGGAGLGAPAPAYSEGDIPAAAPSLQPSPRPGSAGTAIEEPQLEPATRISPPTSTAPSSAPDLVPSGGGSVPRETRRSTPAPTSTRRATYRSRVAGFVNDANDLFQPPKADRRWQYVVLHHSATSQGGYAEIDHEHRERLGTDGCGYHFVIGNGTGSPDGQIEVARRWSEQKAGAHCRDASTSAMVDYGVGICLVGDFDQSAPTPRQIEAAQALVAYLQDRYAIPADHIGVHGKFTRSATVCPGKNFPTQLVLGEAAEHIH